MGRRLTCVALLAALSFLLVGPSTITATGSPSGTGLSQGCTPRPITPPGEGFLEDISVAAGIKDATPPAGMRLHPRVAFADLNGDGFDDIVSHSMFPAVQQGKERFEHLIYLNNGDGTFRDFSDASGLRDLQVALFAFGDVDNDGDQDLFGGLDIQNHPARATESISHKLLLNDGQGHFTVKADSGVEASLGTSAEGDPLYGIGAAVFADFNGDARLDLFVGNGNTGSTGYLMANQLYFGRGDGTFTDATARLGGNEPRLTNGAAACDFDSDGDLDLFVTTYGVSNDGAQDWLFYNDGQGNFEDDAVARGVASQPGGNYWRADLGHGRTPEPGKGPGQYIGGNGFGVDCSDVNNDGHMDIVLAQIAHSTEIPPGYRGWDQATIDALNYTRRWADPSQVLINQGPDGDWTFVNEWLDRDLPYNEGDIDSTAVDVDNDGRLDIAMSRDKKYEGSYTTLDQLGWFGLYHQQDDGQFNSIGYVSGVNHPEDPDGAQRMRGSGIINWSDIDHDGDLDLLLGGGPGASSGHLFRNTIGSRNDWLAVRLVGDGEQVNRDAMGARVTITHGTRILMREVKGSRGTYNSMDTRVLHFGLGDLPCDFTLTVRWPDGTERSFDGATAGRNRYITLRYPDDLVPDGGTVPSATPGTAEPTTASPTATPTTPPPTEPPEVTPTDVPEPTVPAARIYIHLPWVMRNTVLDGPR